MEYTFLKFKLEPYDWQKKAIVMARKKKNLAMFADCGTGKTCAAINILRERYANAKRIRKTLILGPVAVVFNWQNEIKLHSYIQEKDTIVLHQSGKKRAQMFKDFTLNPVTKELDKEGVVITNYEALLNKDFFSLLIEWQPEIVVLDESHLVKNYKAKRSKAVYSLAKGAQHTYIMTGTPIANSPMDVFMQYKIMDKGDTFGSNFFVFRNKYFRDANASWSGREKHFPKWEPMESLYSELTEKIYTKAIRVTKAECLDLPERVNVSYHCAMSTEQERAYKELKRDFITFIKDKKNSGENKAVIANLAITKALRLMQITTGHVKADDGSIIDFGATSRIAQTKELLEQIVPAHKVILWCAFKENVKVLENLCKEMGIKYVKITGDENTRQKEDNMQQFRNDPSTYVVIANRRAGGVGVNLVEAAYSIIFSRTFSLIEEKQSIDRNYRGGSQMHKSIVKIDLYTKGTIEELCLQALKDKEDISKTIIDIADKL